MSHLFIYIHTHRNRHASSSLDYQLCYYYYDKTSNTHEVIHHAYGGNTYGCNTDGDNTLCVIKLVVLTSFNKYCIIYKQIYK